MMAYSMRPRDGAARRTHALCEQAPRPDVFGVAQRPGRACPSSARTGVATNGLGHGGGGAGGRSDQCDPLSHTELHRHSDAAPSAGAAIWRALAAGDATAV